MLRIFTYVCKAFDAGFRDDGNHPRNDAAGKRREVGQKCLLAL